MHRERRQLLRGVRQMFAKPLRTTGRRLLSTLRLKARRPVFTGRSRRARRYGRYWARTSDLRLVEAEQRGNGGVPEGTRGHEGPAGAQIQASDRCPRITAVSHRAVRPVFANDPLLLSSLLTNDPVLGRRSWVPGLVYTAALLTERVGAHGELVLKCELFPWSCPASSISARHTARRHIVSAADSSLHQPL